MNMMEFKYWEEMYARQREEVAKNPQEKFALEMIAKGVDLHESREKSGLSKGAFYYLLEHAEKWECVNMTIQSS